MIMEEDDESNPTPEVSNPTPEVRPQVPRDGEHLTDVQQETAATLAERGSRDPLADRQGGDAGE